MAGDLLVLFVTWNKTYAPYKDQKEIWKGPSIARVMLYNGAYLSLAVSNFNSLRW